MNKKNLLITSGVIALSLLSVSSAHAEEMSYAEIKQTESTAIHSSEEAIVDLESENHDTQTEVTERIFDDSPLKFDETIQELYSLLPDEKQEILEKALTQENKWTSLFKEAVRAHKAKDFKQAETLYEKLNAQLNDQQADFEATATFSQETREELSGLLLFFEDLAEQEQSLSAVEELEKNPSSSAVPKKETIAATEDVEEPALTEDETNVPQTPSPAAFRSAALTVKRSGEEILSETPAHYRGQLKRASDGINTRPWGTSGYQTLRLVGDLVGKEVTVTQEAVTQRATWAYVHVRGTHLKGWVDKAGLEVEQILSEKKVHDAVILTRTSDGINTRPWGTPGFQTLRTVGDLVGHEVTVTKEAVTQRGTWLYIQVNGTDIAGWIDKAGTGPKEILSETAVHYRGKLKRTSDGINTRPWGTTGYQTLRLVGDLVGKEVTVTQEAVTNRATWVYIHVRGTNVQGWVDRAGLEVEQILSEKKVHDAVILTRASDGINTQPWGTPGYQTLRTVGNLVGHEVTVTKEAVTQRGTWLYIQVNGTDIAGWIDKAGTGPKEVLSETAVHYRGKLKRTWDGINTRPWGTTGYQTLRLVGDLVGHEVTITQEAVTNRATWVYIHVRGTNVQGWVDKAGIEAEQIQSERLVNYRAYLNRSSDGINTQPWGTPGYQTLRTVGDLVGREVAVTKEAVTQRATWLYIQVDGTDIAGWIDKAGISVGSVGLHFTFYNKSFEEALNRQMNHGSPQTDLYGDLSNNGSRWENARREDVAYYLNPASHFTFSNPTLDPQIEFLQIATGDLNVRLGPSTSYLIVGAAARNEVYTVTGESNGWYAIDYNGQAGWVHGSYVSLIGQVQYQDRVENQGMLQFLSLSRPSGITVNDLNEELKGKGILEGQGATFIEASKQYGINEIYLVSHALLETGNGTSQLATGVKVNGVTAYNMFGIGAYDHAPVAAGSSRAYEQGWDTPEKAIIGGAKFIASSYINSPVYKQDTLYKMKWNPANPSVHQYATDIGWAIKQTRSLDKVVEWSEKYNLSLKFDIPVYK